MHDAHSVFRLISAFFIANYYYTFIFSPAWCIISGRTKDWATTTTIASLGLTSHISVTKLWFMYINHGAIQEVVSKYLACNSEIDSNRRFAINIHTILRYVKKRAIIFWCVIVFNGVIYIVLPLFRSGRHMPDDNLIYYGLEPMLESPNYEIAKCIICFGVFIPAFATANINSFFIIICGYTEAYMLAMTKELEALWDDALEYSDRSSKDKANNEHMRHVYGNKQIDKFIAERLVFIAKGHVAHVDLIYKVDESFQLCLGIGLISLMCGLIADLLGGLENTYIQMPYSLFIVGMDCLAGQKVMEASMTFENAVYACNWQNFNTSNRKIGYLILINAQKTMSLTAGTITMLNYETFARIIKSVYSAYTAIRSAVH